LFSERRFITRSLLTYSIFSKYYSWFAVAARSSLSRSLSSAFNFLMMSSSWPAGPFISFLWTVFSPKLFSKFIFFFSCSNFNLYSSLSLVIRTSWWTGSCFPKSWVIVVFSFRCLSLSRVSSFSFLRLSFYSLSRITSCLSSLNSCMFSFATWVLSSPRWVSNLPVPLRFLSCLSSSDLSLSCLSRSF